VHVDLGGIGKGYAIDVLTRLLHEWEIDTALVHGGRSSVRALGAPPEKAGWPLTLSNPLESAQILARLHLRDLAVSGSGLQKGQHIIDPRTAHPLTGKRATWVVAPEGALTDALSTAFMVMPPEEIEDYCRSHQEIRVMIFVQDENEGQEQVLRYGAWEEEAVS
jgi:thiamine biosynthesis lipoprotein